MANRYNQQFQLTQEKRVTSLFARVSFGATGAPTLSAANSKGILSVTRNSTGTYTFVFGSGSGVSLQKDSYVKIMGMNVIFNSGASAPAAPGMYIKADNIATTSNASVQVVFTSVAGAAADPANGEIGYIEFIFGDSTAP